MTAVIIPIRTNTQEEKDLLRRALDSLVIQINKRFITVLCQDHSELEINDIVEEYSNKLHIAFLKNTSNINGAGIARNLGLKFAIQRNIEAVIFLDADDMLMPQAVDQLTKELNRNLADVISTKPFHESDHVYDKIDNLITWIHGKIYRTSFLKQNEIYFPEWFKTNEDLNFNLKVQATAKKHFVLQNSTAIWCENKNSITRGVSYGSKTVSSCDYINCMYDFFQYCINHQIRLNEFYKNIPNLYNFYQQSLILNTNSEELKTECKGIINYLIQNKIFTPNTFRIICSSFNSCFVFKKVIYAYPQTLLEWFNDLNIDLIKEGFINESYSD